MSYAGLLEATGRVNDFLNAGSVLSWDARTMMPKAGLNNWRLWPWRPAICYARMKCSAHWRVQKPRSRASLRPAPRYGLLRRSARQSIITSGFQRNCSVARPNCELLRMVFGPKRAKKQTSRSSLRLLRQ